MNRAPRLITRIALFSALCYVLGWMFLWLPNVNLMFFVVFSAGFLWGIGPGLAVGAIGEWLFTFFNPGGPTDPLTTFAQVFGMALGGLFGALFERFGLHRGTAGGRAVLLALAGIACTAAFFVPVNVVDAWLYQPFWPRLITGFTWTLASFAVNGVVFPLLFQATLYLYAKERKMSWRAVSS
jgi:uncharacterized membrane protein